MAVKTCLKPPMSIISSSGSICTFNALQSGLPLKSHSVKVVATQSGSGTPSPDNVRTINGYSAIGVSATGKNLYCKTATNTNNGYIDNSVLDTNGEVASNTSYCISEYIPVRGGEDITIQALVGDRVYVCYYDANKEYIGQGRYSRYTERTYSLPSATTYIRASVPKANIDVFQIEYGDTATSYESFNAHYLVQIGSTVYGGEYDARTGVLTVTHGVVDLGSLTWVYRSNGLFRTPIISGMKTEYLPDWNCEIYSVTTTANYSGWDDKPNNTIGFLSTYGHFMVRDDRYTDANDLKTALNGMKLVYELATPTTIQLPPCPIDILLGENNIWADTGNTSLEAIKIGR